MGRDWFLPAYIRCNLFTDIYHLSHEVCSVYNVIFYSNVNSSIQKVFLFIVFHLPSPLNGAQFISLGFLFYIYFIQKFAKTIFNSVNLTQLIVFLSAISSFMCNHLLLKKNVPSISMPLYISTVYVCHFLLLLYVGGIYVFSTSAYTSKFQSSKSKPHYPISVMHITPNNVHTLPFFHIPICNQIFLCSYFLCTSLSLYIITPFFIIF